MAKIQTYDDMNVEVSWASPFPGVQVKQALNTTMKQMLPKNLDEVTADMLKFLFQAEHTSVVEHAVISFRIEGVSRSFLAQITRHRMASYTSSSQHYQDYSDYPMVVHNYCLGNSYFEFALEQSLQRYSEMLEVSIPKEEARQVLPNASAVNLMWTINARSLHNFFRQRSCLRNVAEMITFCDKVFPLVQHWWPEYAKCLGPACYTDGRCLQGVMGCGRKWTGFSS